MFPARDLTLVAQRPPMPAESGAPGERFAQVTALLNKAVEDGVFPGAVLSIGHLGNVVYQFQVGGKWSKVPEGIKDEMARDTIFDVAGLTQGIVTTTLLMRALESGKVRLEDKVSRYIPEFGVLGKSPVTIEHLLSHSSGLPAWSPYFEELVKANGSNRLGILTSKGARDYIYQSINRSELKTVPGAKQVASDLGFLLLGQLIELLFGAPLDKVAYRQLFQPLGMKNSSYIDLAMVKRRGIAPVRDRIAPTEDCAWRGRVLCGEVHDDNAWAMGGIAGHAGLFTNAQDIHLFAAEMLRAYRGASDFLRRDTVMKFWTGPGSLDSDLQYRLGWEAPNRENLLADAELSNHAVGLTGFTGCSLWIEPQLGVDVVLMSNRVHPSRGNKQIRNFRPELHRTILKAITNS